MNQACGSSWHFPSQQQRAKLGDEQRRLRSATSGNWDISIEVVTVVLPSVIAKLDDLLVREYNLEEKLKKEIKTVRSVLVSMKCALEKICHTPTEQIDSAVKHWARNVRELSYDLEDCTDIFLRQYDSTKLAKQHVLTKIIDNKSPGLIQPKIHHEFANNLRDIRTRILDLLNSQERFVFDNHEVNFVVDRVVTATLETNYSSKYMKVNELVGIDETRDELIKIMMEDNRVPMQQGKIVSIVGFGGLGKTTLAIAVYNKIRTLFDCCAFISVSSRTPNTKNLLESLHYGLVKNIEGKLEDEEQLINNLREFLQQKRYFIVIDDIWDISIWRSIKSALPDNDVGYKIITTTCVHSIAEEVGGPYMLKPLSLGNSRKLLYRRVFGNTNKKNNEDIENEELAVVCYGILKKCAGVPLAIITVASLLAYKLRNKVDWYEVYISIGTGLEGGLDVENMRKILSFSYFNMPPHLRTCLLYLSMFPADYYITKKQLIWKWIAEGFILKQGIPNKSLFEIGESYFIELINRSMIQPRYNLAGMICGCHIHHMGLDFIIYVSVEENFAAVINGMHHNSPLNTIRRLSLQNGMDDHILTQPSKRLEHVRSFIVFPSAIRLRLPIWRFQVLRVLDLQYFDLSQGYNLKHIGDLLHLRYLGLRGTCIDQLPAEIERIQFLQTLDVSRTYIYSLPSIVVKFRHLMCLYTEKSTLVPKGIRSLRSLEELSTLRIDDSTMDNIIEELGHLTKLRVLKIIVLSKWNGKLVECLSKLHDIQILNIEVNIADQHNFGELDGWVAPRHLRRLDAQQGCWFSTLPIWMKPSLLSGLSSLAISVRKLQQADLEILGKLPALRYLSLTVDHGCLGITETFIAVSCLFPCLEECQFYGFIIPVMFQQGAMPRLASIAMEFQVQYVRGISDDGFDLGLGNLPVIQYVTVLFNCKGASEWDLVEAEAAVKHAVEFHPSQPTLRIITNEREVGIVRERGMTSTSSQSRHVKEVHEKHDRYKIDGFAAKAIKTTVSQHMKAADVVGIEDAVNQLMKILTEGNEMSTSQGKIVSIVGLGGLGKTTLARAIYGKIRAQFDCWAFGFSVSKS